MPLRKTQSCSLRALLAIAALNIPLQLSAQENKGNIGNEDITVVKEYQPVLNDVFKINLSPGSDTSSIKPRDLDYTVESKPAKSDFNTSPIKPVRIKDDAIRKLYKGFVKAGFGMENMPMLDLYFNSLRSKNFDAGVSFQHLSARGKINDFGYPGNSSNRLGLNGTRYFDKFSLGADLLYNRNVAHFYGFRSPPELFSKADTRHSMNDIEGKIKLQSTNMDADAWKFNAGLTFYNFSDNRDSRENNTLIQGGLSKLITNATLVMDASAEFGRIDQPLQQFNRSIIRYKAALVLGKDLYHIEAGARMAYEQNDGEGDLRFYPHLRAEYQVIDDAFNVFAEVSGDLERNDLRSFSRQNPFFDRFVPLANTNRKVSITGGTRIKLEHDLMFIASASYQRLKDQPFFYNQFDSLFPVTFSVLYDDANLLRIKGSLEYKYTEKITAAFTAEFNRYNTDNLEQQLYVPDFRFGINGHYSVAEKIIVKADIFYNSGVSGIEYRADSTGLQSSIVDLKGWLDANLTVDYRYSKVLSVFAGLNNLGFARYFRWYEYPSYRFTAMLGATYSF
jgi:hypothetical protein